MTKRPLAIAALLLLVAVGCASTSGQRLDDSARKLGATFWVENHGQDSRKLHESISRALSARGLSATAGMKAERPASFDYLVTYEDRWTWDMRMYLRDLRIQVLDADTNALLGIGRANQSSLSALGLSFEDVVKRAVAALLDGPQPEQTKGD